MLENRIQELHREKQDCVIKAHEENKILCLNNNLLQRKIIDIESIKNREITFLRQEINGLR
jgi:hypothetical protein